MGISESISVRDDNIGSIRREYPDGLHFVVGDTHGETETLKALMDKIDFDPSADHVYFAGDYNSGGSPDELLQYMSAYYREDYCRPGFHMIRGNHEREERPRYYLENLPDILVLRGGCLNYYITHAGMVQSAFRAINADMEKEPEKKVYAYSIDDGCAEDYDLLRQIVWSREGLYSQNLNRQQNWPPAGMLRENRAVILHGHTPYSFFVSRVPNYGTGSLFWEKQHIWFSEDLCSFNLDSNIKGRNVNGETYRGLACVCLEICEKAAASHGGILSVRALRDTENGVFSAERIEEIPGRLQDGGDIRTILRARPRMKKLTADPDGTIRVTDDASGTG